MTDRPNVGGNSITPDELGTRLEEGVKNDIHLLTTEEQGNQYSTLRKWNGGGLLRKMPPRADNVDALKIEGKGHS